MKNIFQITWMATVIVAVMSPVFAQARGGGSGGADMQYRKKYEAQQQERVEQKERARTHQPDQGQKMDDVARKSREQRQERNRVHVEDGSGNMMRNSWQNQDRFGYNE